MSDLRPDGTPYPADEDSPYGRWLNAWLEATGHIHDGYFNCDDLRAAFYAGVADASDQKRQDTPA